MPRRKAPKRRTKVRRSSIQVEIDKTVPEEERKQKLEAFIADFEIERQARLRVIRDDGENLIRKVNSLFHAELLKLPKAVQDMKFTVFKDKYACDVNTALLESTRVEVDKIKKPTNIKRVRKTKMAVIQEDIAVSTTRVTRTAARCKNAPWNDTPLVTPAFNPRLCRAERTEPERCTMMVYGSASSPKIEIPVNGENVLLTENTKLDEESRAVLQSVRQMLNSMLNQ